MRHDIGLFNHLISASTPLDLLSGHTVNQVRGRLTFVDQSVLFIRENYVLDSGWIDYSYHWQTVDNQLIHRWDNAHPVNLPTSPYHQHAGSEENVVASELMTLEMVLTFIATQLTSG